MINLNTIQKLLDSADDENPIRLNASLCLNLKHKDRKCDKCLACSTDAITITDARVELDLKKCVECGLCASVCPTHAFTTKQTDDAILNAVASASNIEFACKRARGTRAPNIEGVMTIACLARLSPDLIVAIGAEHANVWLNDAPCAECPIGARTHPQIVTLTDAATRLLAAWSRGDAIKRYTASADQLIEPRQLARANNSEISRRDVFSLFRSNLGRAAGMVIAASLGAESKSVEAKPVEPLDRAIAKLGKPEIEYIASARFAAIEIAAYCTACENCAKICPTKAIEYRSDKGYFVLGFELHKCLGVECSLCKLICPANAITIQPGAARDDLASHDQKVLRTGSLTLCSKCFTPFATEPGEMLCPMCRNEKMRQQALLRDLVKKD